MPNVFSGDLYFHVKTKLHYLLIPPRINDVFGRFINSETMSCCSMLTLNVKEF